MGCVYKLTSPSRKSYIGVTKKTAEARFDKHKEHALGKRDSGALYSALRKYGPDSFTLEVLITSDDWEKLLALEKEMIRLHRTLSPNGYNISEGGQGAAWHPTEKVRVNCSRGQKKRFQRPEERERLLKLAEKGRLAVSAKWKPIREAKRAAQKAYVASESFKQLHSAATKQGMLRPDVKQKVIACARQRAADPSWRAKISASKKGKPTGRHSLEWSENISKARLRQWADPTWKAQHLEKLARIRAAKRDLAGVCGPPDTMW